jgi:hypothetical protein
MLTALTLSMGTSELSSETAGTKATQETIDHMI